MILVGYFVQMGSKAKEYTSKNVGSASFLFGSRQTDESSYTFVTVAGA
jgi:hypothetical protein